MDNDVYFKVTTNGGASINAGPIKLEVINPFFELKSTVLDQCTHKYEHSSSKSIVKKCKFKFFIISCLKDEDCSFIS